MGSSLCPRGGNNDPRRLAGSPRESGVQEGAELEASSMVLSAPHGAHTDEGLRAEMVLSWES